MTWDDGLEGAALDLLDYNIRWGRYRIRLGKSDIMNNEELLTKYFRNAYERSKS